MRNYYITAIKNYSDDGNHLECHLPLPFQIRRGEDEYIYRDKHGIEKKYNIFKGDKIEKRWIAHLTDGGYHGINPSLEEIFEIKVDADLDRLVNYCFRMYEKSLKLEAQRLKKIKKELESGLTGLTVI